MADINIAEARVNLEKKGFLDISIDVNLDLFAEIEKLKKEKNCTPPCPPPPETDPPNCPDFS